jgi:small GTP-binding protein
MLSENQKKLIADGKEVLSNILMRLTEVGAEKEQIKTLQKAIVQLDELFLIVVVGEFNAGKSALINAILGEIVLAEGVIPTTTRVTMIKWGESKNEKIMDEGYAEVIYPLDLLKEVNFVDSPGTNAIIRQHERLTDEFVPRSDLVLFTTSADRPMTESERQFLQRIIGWGKKVVFVLNKADIFETDESLKQAQDFILQNAAVALGETPAFFPVSARFAQKAMLTSEPEEAKRLREASRLDALENYIVHSLDDEARLRLKIQNPLGVAHHVISVMDERVRIQVEDLLEDATTCSALETTIAGYQSDLDQELGPRLAEVENILHRFEIRGLDFFDRVLRLTNVHHLINGAQVRGDFEKEVLADITRQIEQQVQHIIDWLVEKDLREWQQVMTYLQRRQSMNLSQIVGDGGNPREIQRRALIDKVGKKISTIIESYDQVKEASHLAASVESAVAQTALLEVGAVGLGALVSTALLSTTLDVTGLVAAGTLAIVGFFIIPRKRMKAKEDFRQKIVALRENLTEALSTAFKHESNVAIERLQESVIPYTRYVHAEQEKIEKIQTSVDEMRQMLDVIEGRVQQMID